MNKGIMIALCAALLGSLSTPSLAQSSLAINGRTGPSVTADGQLVPLRQDKSGALATTEAHGRYQEASYRGNVYHLPSGSQTAIAANASAGAFGTVALLDGFQNPPNSGKSAVILGVKTALVSGTPGGPLLYNFFCGANILTSSGTIRNALLSNSGSGGSAMVPHVQDVMTTSPALTSNLLLAGPVGGPAAIAAGAGVGSTYDDVAGLFIVPPGCLFGITDTATGTSHVSQYDIIWEEIPYP